MRIYLIRHGKTPGNQLNRYIGITDEPVLEEDQEQLKKSELSESRKTFCKSPASLPSDSGLYLSGPGAAGDSEPERV